MARKEVSVLSAVQLDFGFEVMDAQGNRPGFLYHKDEVLAAIKEIEAVKWASVDVETTGLTEASMPQDLTRKEFMAGGHNAVRMRTIQARIPTVGGRKGPRKDMAFDADRMGPELTQKVSEALLTRRMFIAHNAGFDLYWLRRAQGRTAMPQMVVDTMLLTRLLNPRLVLKRLDYLEGVTGPADIKFASEAAQAAWKSLISGSSGGSLADVVLAMFGHIVDKTYQKPKNWTGLLGFEHYDYAIDDVVWADRILTRLLGQAVDEADLLLGYLGVRARVPTVKLIEPQVPDLVRLREAGMPMNTDVAARYVEVKREDLKKAVSALLEIEPALEPFALELANPDSGIGDGLKRALATAFEARGVRLRKTANTGAPQVGEKDLRACRAARIDEARPLFNAWVAVCKAKKLRQMSIETIGFATRSDDGRLHSLMSHGPVTGRLSASEPNCFRGDTEILTPEGWVRFDRLKKGVPVAQYAAGQITFTQPTAYIEKDFEGKLVRNQTASVDLLTTPEHRCLVFHPTKGEQVYEAKDYPEGHRQLHAASFAGPGLDLSDRELSFIALAHRIGTPVCQGYLFSFDSDSRFERFLALLGLDPNADRHLKHLRDDGRLVFVDSEHPLAQTAQRYLGKRAALGKWVLQMSRDQVDLFLQSMTGWVDNLSARGHYIAYSSQKRSDASWMQTLYTLSGKRTRMRRSAPLTTLAGYAPAQWELWGPFSRADTPTTGRTQKLRSYRGKVYCVSVPSSYILIRQKGVTMITGQCQQWPRDQLFRAMCMSGIEPGRQTLTLAVTAANKGFIERVLERELAEEETHVTMDTAWATAMFYSDKDVPGWPQDEYARTEAFLQEHFTHVIVASDFGALDVRVGAALCIRAQREMLALAQGHAVPGVVQPPDRVVRVIKQVAPLLDQPDAVPALASQEKVFAKEASQLQEAIDSLKEELDRGAIQKKAFFRRRGEFKERLHTVQLGRRLAQCLRLGAERGEREYSALRDAFVADIDIHTFTGMKLVGRDPMREFEGLELAARKELEKHLKKELGPRRQQGKIANLSLLYGMADAGFQEAAARGYDEHWTLEEARDIRELWLDSYPEVDLWHLWTECLKAGTVYLPDATKDRLARTDWWLARTLSGREIVAFGLNAALSYQDQSSGADILGLIMHTLQTQHPEVFETSINQVHDEQVFCVPREKFSQYLPLIEQIMVEQANSQTMPYGVPTAVSPACGPLWVKD